MAMPYKIDTPDSEVARTATSQHGIVTARQLAAAGLGRMAISERVKKGQLHRLHRGVYAVGHRAPSWHGRWMAAVLACGEGAVLSHHSAAALWELLKPFEGPIHVSVPTTSGRKSPARHPPPPLSLPHNLPRAVSLALLPRSRRWARETAPHHPPPRDSRHHRHPHDRRPPRLIPAPAASPAPRDPPSRAQRSASRRRRERPDPQRPRVRLPRPLLRSSHPAPRGQREARPLGGRLPLAR